MLTDNDIDFSSAREIFLRARSLKRALHPFSTNKYVKARKSATARRNETFPMRNRKNALMRTAVTRFSSSPPNIQCCTWPAGAGRIEWVYISSLTRRWKSVKLKTKKYARHITRKGEKRDISESEYKMRCDASLRAALSFYLCFKVCHFLWLDRIASSFPDINLHGWFSIFVKILILENTAKLATFLQNRSSDAFISISTSRLKKKCVLTF